MTEAATYVAGLAYVLAAGAALLFGHEKTALVCLGLAIVLLALSRLLRISTALLRNLRGTLHPSGPLPPG